MFGDFVDFHRRKGAQPHVQGERGALHPHRIELFEQGVGEVQTRRRRRDRSSLFGPDGLVALVVFVLNLLFARGGAQATDVRRKRRRADRGEQFLPRADPTARDPATGLRLVDQFDHRTLLRVDQLHARSQPTAAQHQTRFIRTLPRREPKPFDASARFLVQHQTRGKDARVIEHQQIARAQVLRQLRKGMVRALVPRTVMHEQTRTITTLARVPRDQLYGQLEVELTLLHALPSRAATPSDDGSRDRALRADS